jgi:transketolase
MPARRKAVRPGERLARRSIDTIRLLSADLVERARSGHPGAPMGMAPVAYVLWHRFLKHNPADPDWPDRDRFVLSMGHASALLYSLLHLTGYDLAMDDLKAFRQWGSRTPGHPERGHPPGVETTTGPLGQGFANAVGMAIAERFLAARHNETEGAVVDHRTWVFCSDGDLMEGLVSEAASLAGHLGLGKLTCFYDDNRITIDGPTDLAFSEDVAKRFRAYGWHVQGPVEGEDLEGIAAAITRARRSPKPSLILCRTVIGRGSPGKAGTAEVHGSPLGPEELKATRRNLGWSPDESFSIPDEVRRHLAAREIGARAQRLWEERLRRYTQAHPRKAAALRRELEGELPAGWADRLPRFDAGSKAVATRSASGKVLAALAPVVPNLIGGSADLAPSNKTLLGDLPAQSNRHPEGRNLHFGVREHAMAGIMNGLLLHGGLRVYGGTFLVFSDYLRPAARLAAMMGLPAVYVFTHDSIGLGEDGPTHQPVEQAMSLRLIPGLRVVRPADANETVEAWRMALEHTDGPTALLLSRQDLPVLDPERTANARRGGYVLSRTLGPPRVVLIATGSEVHLALEAKALLESQTITTQVVSLPCWELFAEQDEAYIARVLPQGAMRVAIEAGVTLGWERWVRNHSYVIGLDRFGASAPYEVLFREFGLTAENVVDRVLRLLED